MFKKIFALVVASVALSDSAVSAGSVRGVFKEKEDTNPTRRRQLKEDKNVVPITPAPVPTAPTPPPAPVPPPTPTGSRLWVQKCMNGDFEGCLRNSNLEVCAECVFAQSKLSTTSDFGIRTCGKTFCGGCVQQALDFFDCGTDRTKPETPPPVPVQTAVTPAPVPAATIPAATEPPKSSPEVCAATAPRSGDPCSTGSMPWVYCCYDIPGTTASTALVCSCLDGDNRYVCNIGSTGRCAGIISSGGAGSAPPPVPAPAPVTAAPVTVPVPVITAPFANPVPVTAAPVANPVSVTTAPFANPVPITAAPVANPVPVTTAPVANPVPVTVAPVANPVPVTMAPVAGGMAQQICESLEGEVSSGDECGSLLTLSLNILACGFSQTIIENGITSSGSVVCTCGATALENKANATWSCDGTLPPVPDEISESVSPPIDEAAIQPVGAFQCPPNNSPPSDGDSCEGILPDAGMSAATCSFTQQNFVGNNIQQFTTGCICRRSTLQWSCSAAN